MYILLLLKKGVLQKNKKNSNMVGMLEPSLMFSRAKIGFSTIQIKPKSVLYNTFYLKKLIFTNLPPSFFGAIDDKQGFRAGP